MSKIFDKVAAVDTLKNIAIRLDLYASSLAEDKKIDVTELTEQITICVLQELRDNRPPDAQFIISAGLGMSHACMQMVAVETQPNLSPPLTQETFH